MEETGRRERKNADLLCCLRPLLLLHACLHYLPSACSAQCWTAGSAPGFLDVCFSVWGSTLLASLVARPDNNCCCSLQPLKPALSSQMDACLAPVCHPRWAAGEAHPGPWPSRLLLPEHSWSPSTGQLNGPRSLGGTAPRTFQDSTSGLSWPNWALASGKSSEAGWQLPALTGKFRVGVSDLEGGSTLGPLGLRQWEHRKWVCVWWRHRQRERDWRAERERDDSTASFSPPPSEREADAQDHNCGTVCISQPLAPGRDHVTLAGCTGACWKPCIKDDGTTNWKEPEGWISAGGESPETPISDCNGVRNKTLLDLSYCTVFGLLVTVASFTQTSNTDIPVETHSKLGPQKKRVGFAQWVPLLATPDAVHGAGQFQSHPFFHLLILLSS